MASFPALPSGNNPYAASAAGYASAASNVYNGLMTRLQAAAQQHATLANQQANTKAAQAQQGLKDEMEAFNQGWIPVKGPADPGYPVADPGGPANAPDPPPTLIG